MNLIRHLSLIVLIAAVVAVPLPGGAQTALYHGRLSLAVKGTGSIDRRTGNAIVIVRRWILQPSPASDGIHPDREPLLIALGDENFLLPSGGLHPDRGGRTFTYRGHPMPSGRSIRLARLALQRDGSWAVRFTLTGVDLSRLQLEDPVCRPLAVIIGDDDGFSGVNLTSPSFRSRRLTIPTPCDQSNSWPWIQN